MDFVEDVCYGEACCPAGVRWDIWTLHLASSMMIKDACTNSPFVSSGTSPKDYLHTKSDAISDGGDSVNYLQGIKRKPEHSSSITTSTHHRGALPAYLRCIVQRLRCDSESRDGCGNFDADLTLGLPPGIRT